MAVVRFAIPVERMTPIHCADVVVQPYDPTADAGLVNGLACRCAAEGTGSGPTVTTLAAELAGRPGRQVWGWLAWSGDGVDRRIAKGFVALIGVEAAAGVRCSIGWLFVDPEFRRQGVGQTLVATAAMQARSLGATEIYAETLDRWPAAVRFWEAVRLAAGGAVARLSESGESRETAEG